MSSPFDFTASVTPASPRRPTNRTPLYIGLAIGLTVAVTILVVVLALRGGSASLREEYEKRLLFEEWDLNRKGLDECDRLKLPPEAHKHFLDGMEAADIKALQRFDKRANELGEYPPSSHSRYDGVRH